MECCWFRFLCAVVVDVYVISSLSSLCTKKLGFNLCHLNFIFVFLIFINIDINIKSKTQENHIF